MMAPDERSLRKQIAARIRQGSLGRVDCQCPECAKSGVPHASWLASMSMLAEIIERGDDGASIAIVDVESFNATD